MSSDEKLDAAPTAEALTEKRRRLASEFGNNVWLRIYRAVSWVARAESESAKEPADSDTAFIFLWIAFNAAYAVDDPYADPVSTPLRFKAFIQKAADADKRGAIRNYVFSNEEMIDAIVDNRYLFNPFWEYQNEIPGSEDWQSRLAAESRNVRRYFREGATVDILATLFPRLYVLRNQLVHGAATWNSVVNRVQVENAAGIMGFMVPVFIDLMMDNPEAFSGRPYYPVVGDPLGINC